MDEKRGLTVAYEVGGQKITLTRQIVQDYIMPSGSGKITQQEFAMFSALCKARGLNPFLREAYCIKYSDRQPAATVVGKDAFLKRAAQNPDYDGREQGIIVRNISGEIEYRNGCFYMAGETVVGGWARVYRKSQSHPTEISVSFDECASRKSDGSLNTMWSSRGATMIEKVALVRALREAFPEDLAGMYDADEIKREQQEQPEMPEMPARIPSRQEYRAEPEPIPAMPEPEYSDIPFTVSEDTGEVIDERERVLAELRSKTS